MYRDRVGPSKASDDAVEDEDDILSSSSLEDDESEEVTLEREEQDDPCRPTRRNWVALTGRDLELSPDELIFGAGGAGGSPRMRRVTLLSRSGPEGEDNPGEWQKYASSRFSSARGGTRVH